MVQRWLCDCQIADKKKEKKVAKQQLKEIDKQTIRYLYHLYRGKQRILIICFQDELNINIISNTSNSNKKSKNQNDLEYTNRVHEVQPTLKVYT